MKKRIGILLAACCVSLAACGKGGTVNEGDQVNGSNPVQESVQTPQVSSQEPEESVQAPEESSQEPEESSQAPEEDSQPDESQFPEGLPSVDVQSMTPEELQSLADSMSEEEFWMWFSTLDSEDMDYLMENYATVTGGLLEGEELEQWEEENGVTTSAHWDWDEENEQWVLVEDAPEDGGEGQEPSAE